MIQFKCLGFYSEGKAQFRKKVFFRIKFLEQKICFLSVRFRCSCVFRTKRYYVTQEQVTKQFYYIFASPQNRKFVLTFCMIILLNSRLIAEKINYKKRFLRSFYSYFSVKLDWLRNFASRLNGKKLLMFPRA